MSNKNDYIILLDNGHGADRLGKRSPDGKLKEYAYAREIVQRIYSSLKDLGYNPHILVPETNDISLSVRVKRANQLYSANNKKALLISVHCNAAGSDNNVHSARGWSVFVAQNASSNSKKLADCLKNAADKEGLKVRLQYPDKSLSLLHIPFLKDVTSLQYLLSPCILFYQL